MKTVIAVAAIVAGFAVSTPAFADPQYSKEDIVKFFTDSANLGQSRGICVGTLEECRDSAPKPKGFDMLINFDLNSAELTRQAQENLAEFAAALKEQQLTTMRFVVEGHTDASGAETYNEGLSERRAESVTSFLLDNGISRDQIKAVGLGEQNPRVPDPYDPVNRRVEMKFETQ
jgi:outer membrane protein OmpA-like peptidoglycan-associated protein